ncbi:hypothetical protein IW261DRAFT_1421022 [Armillaria novae-zelandiae]|uniref:Uncharacterized protein n=1 Tax=Armillaria novae-zelandiae TaxID=153914 RepID=A0AA39TB50_9AGAR|nr:hypothetical protein IW261DRAFT_1421022 [Armillaria novae-zelandiae]
MSPPRAPSVDPGRMLWSRQQCKYGSIQAHSPVTRSVDEVRENPFYGINGDINDNYYPFAPPEHIGEEDKTEVALNNDGDIGFVKELMGDFNVEVEDSNRRIEICHEAVVRLMAIIDESKGSLRPYGGNSIQKIEQAQVAIIISQVPFKLWPLTQLQVNLTGSWHARHRAFESRVYCLDDDEEDDAVPIDMHTFKHGYQILASNIEGQ